MAGVEKYGSPAKVQRTGNDWVYGNGIDGDVTISGTVTLTSDKYYNTLNVPLGNVLLTNGFRVFVKGTATINGVVGIGSVSGNVNGSTNGTISSHTSSVSTGTTSGNSSGTISYRLGGQGGGATNPSVTELPSYLAKRIEAMTGIYFDVGALPAGQTSGKLLGGSPGTTGSSGSPVTSYTNANPAPPGFTNTWPGKAAPTTWPNKAGSAGGAGSAGSAGTYPPNAHSVGQPGGRGNTGATGGTGSDGNAGTAGSAPNPPIAASGGGGGAGGQGGGVVVLCARSIVGTGTIMSLGVAGAAGSVGATSPKGPDGSAGTKGDDGSTGAAGSAAPNLTVHHHHSSPIHEPHTHACCTGHTHHEGNPAFKTSPTHSDHHHSHNHIAHIHAPCCTVTPGHHYTGGAGGAGGTGGAGGVGGPGGTGSPAVTGGTGKRGGAGGGGAIIVITESTPSSINYDVRSATTADSDTVAATNGSAYIILN